MPGHAGSKGCHDTLKGVQGNATVSPDAFSILRMSKTKLCACMSKHASQLSWQDTLKGVQGIATASPDAFSILRVSHNMRLHVVSQYALACRGMQTTMLARHTERCPGRCVSRPDAFSILRMRRICACVSRHAGSKGCHDTLKVSRAMQRQARMHLACCPCQIYALACRSMQAS